MVNKSFNLRLWNVAFHKTRASCSYFSKFIRPLISPMPSMCSNPLNMGYRQRCRSVFNIGGYNSAFLPFFRDFEILGGIFRFCRFFKF